MKKRRIISASSAVMAAILSGMLMMYVTAFMLIGLLMMGF